MEKGRYSPLQLYMLVVGFLLGSATVTTPGRDAGHDVWVAIVLGLMEGLLIAAVFTRLARQFKDKSLADINNLVYGPLLGRLVSIIFIWYLLHMAALVLDSFSRFVKVDIYPNTPIIVIMLSFTVVCASSLNRGLETIARLGLVLTTITIMLIAADTIMLIPQMDMRHLLPVLDIPVGKLLWAAHGAASFPFGETVAFLMVLGFINDPARGPAAVAWGMVTAGIFLVIAAVRNAAVLGPMALVYNYQSYAAVQMIDVGRVLTRMEVVVAVILVCTAFVKLVLLFYSTVLGLAQVCNLHSYRTLIIPTGILVVILAYTNLDNIQDILEFARGPYRIYVLPFQMGIPLLTLALAKLRRLPAGEGD